MPSSVAVLISALVACQDEDESARLIGELQRRGDVETLAAARRLTRSETPRERILGAAVLAQIGCVYPNIEPFVDVRRAATARLRELLGSDPDAGVVRAAIAGLGSLSALAALDEVLSFATDADAETRLAVAMAVPGLTRWAEPNASDVDRVLAALASLSADADGDVRNWALFALARQYAVDTPQLRDLFADHVDDPDPDARAEAIAGLARRRDARALPEVVIALHPDTATETIIEAAAHLGDDRLLPSLEELASSGWADSSTLVEAIRACDPQQRARWAAIGAALASTLTDELAARLGDAPFTVEVGREPLEYSLRVTATWRLRDGVDSTLDYDLVALFDVRLEGDSGQAAAAFRHDIADALSAGQV